MFPCIEAENQQNTISGELGPEPDVLPFMSAPLPRFSVLLASLALPWAAHSSERVLVDHGASHYEIVCAAEAGPAAQLAAKELRTWIKTSTGADLPRVTTPGDGPHIFVGSNPWSTAAGITTEGLKPEGWRLRTVGDDLHIVGMDVMRGSLMPKKSSATQTGTLSGVYDFLEREAGVLFLWHDSLGTIVPKRDRVTIKDSNIESAPAWTYRHLAYGPEGQMDETLFGRRLGLGHSYTVTHSHAWFSIAPIEKYGKEHPEWYAEINGKREPAYYMEHHGGQVCTTNPEVIDLFAKAATDFFKAQPGRDMFSLSPNDGSGFCTCTKCRVLDTGVRADGKPLMADRLITFYNAIAEKVAQVYPDKLLGAYAYSFYREPPQHVKPHPNLYIVHATNTAFHQGLNWPQEEAMEKQWRWGAKHLAKYDIYYSPDSSLNLVAPVTKHLVEKLRSESASGIEGGYLYMGQSYEQLGCGHYLLARLMWDPSIDSDALAKQYYRALYGEAAPSVQAWYDLLESRLIQVRRQSLDTKVPAIREALRTRPGLGSPAFILAAYEPVLKQAAELIAKARACVLNKDEQARLQRLVDQQELLDTTVRGMHLAARIEFDATISREEAAEFLKLIDQRQAVRSRLRAYAPTQCKSLDAGDAAETISLAPKGALAQLARVLVDSSKETRIPRLFPKADFESVKAGQEAETLRWSTTGGASIALDSAQPHAGKQAVRIIVPEGATGSLNFTADVKENTAYRLTFAHWNDVAVRDLPAGDDADAVTRGGIPIAPRSRLICRDKKGKAIGKNQWSGIGAQDLVKQWHVQPQLVQTPAGTQQISFSIFLQHPGTYLLDDVMIEELGSVN